MTGGDFLLMSSSLIFHSDRRLAKPSSSPPLTKLFLPKFGANHSKTGEIADTQVNAKRADIEEVTSPTRSFKQLAPRISVKGHWISITTILKVGRGCWIVVGINRDRIWLAGVVDNRE